MALTLTDEHIAVLTEHLKESMTSIVDATMLPRKITGTKITHVLTDEFTNWPKLIATIASFKDPKWPSADVTVEEEILRPTDPRHPNPRAGAIKEYVIVAGGRRSRPERTQTVAIINAENLHKRLVAALQKDIDDQLSVNPTYAMF